MKNVCGFTLIELLVVIALIGIIASMAIPQLLGIKNRHDVNKTVQDISDTCTGMKKELNISTAGAQSMGEIIAKASPLFAYTHKKEIYYSAEFMEQCASHPMYLELEDYDKKNTTVLSGEEARESCAAFDKMVKDCNLEIILPKLVAQVKKTESDGTRSESAATDSIPVEPVAPVSAPVPASQEPAQSDASVLPPASEPIHIQSEVASMEPVVPSDADAAK